MLFRWCSFNIEEVLCFGCPKLDSSKILSSTSFKTFCFHSLRLNLRIPCLVHQLFAQVFRLKIRSDLVPYSFRTYFGASVKSFLSFLLLIILRYPASLCLWYWSIKHEAAQWHGKMELFIANASDLKQIC